MSLNRVGEKWTRSPHPATATKSGRKLVAERLAQLELISERTPKKDAKAAPDCATGGDGSGSVEPGLITGTSTNSFRESSSTRPQAKTAARKAFEKWWGVTPLRGDAAWAVFQAGWRLARGAKPTRREGAT